jgi:hypothetical protein
MAALPDIDAAIGRLDAALRGAGLPGLERPSDVTTIEAIADEVSPYVLPAELRRFWEQVDPEPFAVVTFPMLRGPAHSLELLRGLRALGQQPPLAPPPILLPLDYSSHCYGAIELGSEWGDVYVSIDHRVEQRRRSARLDAAGPHPLYGELHSILPELESWPAHWLAASGIDLRDRVPLGTTHSIAELVAAGKLGTSRGRIHALVTSLGGSSEGALVGVDDGTASLDVWCPSGTSPWGPVHRQRFEFDVTIEAHALAVAADIRPLD